MIKLLLATLIAFSSFSTSAGETIYFCQKVEFEHGGAQFMRIENSDDFELEVKGKYLHELKAKTTQPTYTSLSIDNGMDFQEYSFEQDCSVKQKTHIILEDYL